MADPLAEMSPADHELLVGHLNKNKPEKILEVGVSAGGTTKLLLEAMDRGSCLHSVDINTRYYKDTSKSTGFVAEAIYSPSTHGQWLQYFGTDVAQCIKSIGGDIDFVVLDTVHALPGEILSFLSVLPYMAKKSVLFLHDTSLHFKFKMENDFHVTAYQRAAYCNTLLFNAIYSYGKFNSRDIIPNSGVVLIDREAVMENIYQVLNVLALDWLYIPEAAILDGTRKIVSKFYTEYALGMYDLAILYNLNKN